MKQFWSLTLMVIAGCVLIFGSEYSLQGNYHRNHHRVVATMDYHSSAETATIRGRTKHGVIVTFRSGKKVRQVISNKQDGRFLVRMSVKGQKRVVVQVVGQKPKVLKIPVVSKS